MTTVIDILGTVRALVGRRRQITRDEMQAILIAIHGPALPDRSTIGGRDADGHLYMGEEWIRDRDQELPATARAWARLCHGITCVSVFPDGVRYDEPGTMHPLQHAPLTFVAADVVGDECGTIGYLRRHADRVLVVRD
ncbi:MAG: hypothetical protein A3H96_11255 [Acidobacteria bacterium RIFCSPLOWO2_02_FULL_67_36]|nr:MAG: hypothetical protein A3H96_11255 [Acidobacteria bacterium RIFCSPLOWO2_02_FULL_67_36]OFW23975.1 MAG: hypothetical protein A3G21_03625 [Acidobacteria bacterium RIFCSPLOWO2_12_FULL_66_21]